MDGIKGNDQNSQLGDTRKYRIETFQLEAPPDDRNCYEKKTRKDGTVCVALKELKAKRRR